MALTTLPPTITDATVTLSMAATNPGMAAGQYYAYATIADLRYELPNIDSYSDLTATVGSAPINMNGNSLLAQELTLAALELQNMLDHYYQMPYVGTNSVILLTLRDMNMKLGAARVIDRYFTGGAANEVSPSAAARRSWAELIVVDIANGRIRWDNPFGDAVPRGMLPAYQIAAAATVAPSPYDANPLVANPIFDSTGSRFRRGRYL